MSICFVFSTPYVTQSLLMVGHVNHFCEVNGMGKRKSIFSRGKSLLGFTNI